MAASIVDSRSQQPMGGTYDYDHMRLSRPQFSNPWTSSSAGSNQQLYNSQQQPQPADPYSSRAQYAAPLSAPLTLDSASHARSYANDYAAPTSTATGTSFLPASAERYPADHYSSSYNNYNASRYANYLQSSRAYKAPTSLRTSFSEAVDASQGMVAMSQQDFATPRGVYPPRNASADYGFPAGRSDHASSISSTSSYPYYGSYQGGSVDGSVAGSSTSDYSSTSEDLGQARTLPVPTQSITGYPSDPTQMMTQFNSKLAAGAQKKHKCKICDKRFTRPSSLQTHMYSHTGEKPFACTHEGCGRHFSVVSNLRRHTKCHKSDGAVDDSASPEA